MNPPIYNLLPYSHPNSSNQYVSVNSCEDQPGLFQVLPSVNKTLATQFSPTKIQLKFNGHALQAASKYLSLIAVYYEGELFFSRFETVKPNVKSSSANVIISGEGSRLFFEMNYELPQGLPLGVYFMNCKMYDVTGQPYLDVYYIFQVKLTDGNEVEAVLKNKELLKNGKITINDKLAISDKIDWIEEIPAEMARYLMSVKDKPNK